jgi:DNA polymerase-3 subunit delta'
MSFRDVVGHRRLVSLVARAIARDSLTPSLILAGPEGVGKKLTAVAIAQMLNCARRDGRDACGECNSCDRIARGAHADVLIVEPGETGTIKIDQVRAAIDRAVYRPFEGRRRTAIIDGADALTPQAQNALLKTLEEPLPASVFILVTSTPDALLPTVRSRCAQLRFARLETADVAAVLERKHRFARADALKAAAASEGSLARALDLRADEFEAARAEAEDLLGVSGRDAKTRLEHAKGLLKGGGSAPEERAHLGARLQALASLLRDVGLLASGADVRLLAHLDRRAALEPLVRALGSDRAARAFAAVTNAQDALDRNVSPKVVADWVSLHVH